MPTTTQAKLINRLDKIAASHSFDLIIEPLASPNYEKRTHLLFQTKERFTTVLEVVLVFFDGGIFNADISVDLDILPSASKYEGSPLQESSWSNGYVVLQRVEPAQGDRINEFLFLIETALETYNNFDRTGC